MEMEFTVGVIPKKRIMGPRVESATPIMAMGLGGSLDDAFRAATASMATVANGRIHVIAFAEARAWQAIG